MAEGGGMKKRLISRVMELLEETKDRVRVGGETGDTF